MHKNRYPLLAIIILLISLTGNLAVKAAPAPDTNAYSGVDIVFLVDQSGSMSGLCNGCPFNDPLDLRFYALSYAMKWMGDNYVGVDTNKIPFRVAIVNFGTTAEVWDFDPSNGGQYWQEIAPVSQADWDTLYAKIGQDLDTMKTKYKAQSLGDTDFAAAFKEANRLFSSEYLPNSQGEHHQRAIVVLTDGHPNPQVLQGKTLNEYMEELTSYTRVNFPEPDYRIYVIGMPDEKDPYWSSYRSYWEAITNDPCPGEPPVCPDLTKDRASLVSSNQDVGYHFLHILIDLTQINETPIAPGKNILPPYLKTAIFTLFKSNMQENLTLTDPSGKVISDLDPNVQVSGQNGPIEVVRINSPLPGEWLIVTNSPEEDVIITKREIFAQSRLDSPLSGQVQYMPVKIRYALLDESGNPLPDYGPQYPLLVEAELRLGDQKWPLLLNSIQPGSVYEGTFTPLDAGEYSIFVHASTKDISGRIVEIYNDKIGSFVVSGAILQPDNLPTSWPQYQSHDVVFELRNGDGFLIQPDQAGNSEIKIATTILANGVPDGAEFPLTSQGDGSYKASYAPQLVGEHVVHIRATIRDQNGNEQVISDSDIARFGVDPTVKVLLKLLQPTDRISTENNTESWSLQTQPLVVEVALQDDKNNPINPADLFDDPDAGLQLELNDKDNNPIQNAPAFKLNKVTETYRTETSELGVGQYLITVKGNALKQGYVYEEAELPLQVTRVVNPWLINTSAGILGFLVIVIPLGTYAGIASARRRRHPCRGRLLIVDGSASQKFNKILDGEKSNHIIYPAKEINPITGISRILVECGSDVDQKAGRVNVSVWTYKEKDPIINRLSMGPESVRRVARSNFWLLKDPNTDQIVEMRDQDMSTDPS